MPLFMQKNQQQLPQQNQYLQGNPGISPDANTRWMQPTDMTGGMTGGSLAKNAPGVTPGSKPGGAKPPMNPTGLTGSGGNGTMLDSIRNGSAGPVNQQNGNRAAMGFNFQKPPVNPTPINPAPTPGGNGNLWQPQNTLQPQQNNPGGFNWGDPNEIRRYFQSRGVTPNASSPDYWAQKWNEWGKNDPAYFMDRLANADEIIGGPQNSPYAFMANNPNNNANQNPQGMFSPAMLQQLLAQLFGNGNFQTTNAPSQSTYFQQMNPQQMQGNGFDVSSFLKPITGLG